jgi:4-alpha-glucanotransferase
MEYPRVSGVLLHPTSLPGPFGIGDLGPAAYDFIDFLHASGTRLWQLLPLGPTGYGDSPYQCFSSFAGNPYLISPEGLLTIGVLREQDLAASPAFSDDAVDYGAVIAWKNALLDTAFDRFRRARSHAARDLRSELATFRTDNATWLEDFALFMALKEIHDLRPWTEWEPELRDRDQRALARARRRLARRIDRHVFVQFLFSRQWQRLRSHTAAAGVRIIGDIPMYVAHDSSDVWAHPNLFRLDEDGSPTVVAGVPPDYFAETGQLWGNPLYDWDAHAAEKYDWWISRISAVLGFVDIIRVDHFRAFADYWEIPGDAPTAASGQWRDGPGRPFFERLRTALGDLPIIAEDLGDLSDAVHDLRNGLGLPGMKVLQFAFATDEDDDFLPHNYPENCVVYTGTHDNNTIRGWWDEESTPAERRFVRRYFGVSGRDIVADFLRGAWQSVARIAVAPMQDLLELPASSRMNVPSVPAGNWQWRMPADSLSPELAQRLADLNTAAGR